MTHQNVALDQHPDLAEMRARRPSTTIWLSNVIVGAVIVVLGLATTAMGSRTTRIRRR